MRQRFSYVLLPLGTIAGIVIVLRAVLGPIDTNIFKLHSPLAIETLFALCFFALVIAWPGSSSVVPLSSVQSGRAWFVAVSILAVTAGAFAFNLADPFLSDDYILVNHAQADLPRAVALLRTPGGDGSYRPLGYLYFGVVKAWAGTEPLKWHACGLVLHLLNCALVFWLTLRLWSDAAAALAALILFGLHGTRPEVVSWTAGSFDLLSTLFVLASAALFFAPRKKCRNTLDALCLLLMVLGIVTKESAYAYPFLIVGLAASCGRVDRRTLRFVGLALGVCAALFAYRFVLFHGPGGYVDSSTGQPQILSLHLLPSLKALFARIWVILLFPVNWDRRTGASLAGSLAIGCASLLYIATSRRKLAGRSMAALAATVVACALPVVHLVLIGQSVLGSRVLYLPSVAFCMMMGLLVSSRERVLPLTMLAIFTGGVLGHNLRGWHAAAIAADAACSAAARSGITDSVHDLPRTMDGVYFFANGFDDCVRMKTKER